LLDLALQPFHWGSTVIQISWLNRNWRDPLSKLTLAIDDITLYPIQDHSPAESDRLSYEPGIQNDIVIRFGLDNCLRDIELLDGGGLKYQKMVGHIQLLYPYCLIIISEIINTD
jgi:hypothetical protein